MLQAVLTIILVIVCGGVGLLDENCKSKGSLGLLEQYVERGVGWGGGG